MKELEKLLDYTVDGTYGFIVRLDGKGFSKFTKKYFKKPYDEKLDQIFQRVTEKLVTEFGTTLAYTQSDEITLYFNTSNHEELYFSGRIQKIVSLLSAKTSVLFISELYKENLFDAVNALPCFDARVFNVGTLEDVYKSFEFRYFDCLRNGRLNLSVLLPKSKRLNKSGKELISEVKEETGYDYFSLPLSYRKGTFFRKEKEIKEFEYNGLKGDVLRTVITKINIDNFPESCLDFEELLLKESSLVSNS